MGVIESLSKALCQTFSGDAERFYDGMFTYPYEFITSTLDPEKIYYFDNMLVDQDTGKQHPQIYSWRFYGWQAQNLIPLLAEQGYRLEKDDKK